MSQGSSSGLSATILSHTGFSASPGKMIERPACETRSTNDRLFQFSELSAYSMRSAVGASTVIESSSQYWRESPARGCRTLRSEPSSVFPERICW